MHATGSFRGRTDLGSQRPWPLTSVHTGLPRGVGTKRLGLMALGLWGDTEVPVGNRAPSHTEGPRRASLATSGPLRLSSSCGRGTGILPSLLPFPNQTRTATKPKGSTRTMCRVGRPAHSPRPNRHSTAGVRGVTEVGSRGHLKKKLHQSDICNRSSLSLRFIYHICYISIFTHLKEWKWQLYSST